MINQKQLIMYIYIGNRELNKALKIGAEQGIFISKSALLSGLLTAN